MLGSRFSLIRSDHCLGEYVNEILLLDASINIFNQNEVYFRSFYSVEQLSLVPKNLR